MGQAYRGGRVSMKNEKAISNLDSLEEIVQAALKKNGMDAKTRTNACSEIISEFVRICGGNLFYVSTLYHEQIAERNNEIMRKFNGHNHADLAREHGISVPHLYRIIKEASDARRRRDQPALF